MRNVLLPVTVSLLIGAVVPSHAELPAPTTAEKAAAAATPAKDAAEQARTAKALESAQDKAVSNYRKSQRSSSPPTAPAQKPPHDATSVPALQPGADHAAVNPPTKTLTGKEAQTKMPTPGQANDHSSTSRETVPSGR
jgi:hypothetical protein